MPRRAAVGSGVNAIERARDAGTGFAFAGTTRRRLLRFAVVFAAVATAAPAFAEGTDTGLNIGKLGVELGALAVIVLVVESALATIFQWRLYRMLFNNRALKTVVMVAVGLIIVLGFNYDIFGRLMAELSPGGTTPDSSAKAVSVVLSALIIAGGSAGVNTLLQRLGFRNPVQAEPARPVLNENQAWVSIRVNRKEAVGPVQIAVREAADDPQASALAGTVRERGFWETVKEAFTADAMRFPNYGGRTVTVGKTYEIVAMARRPLAPVNGAPQDEAFSIPVYKGSFASRAIVDFNVDV